MRRAVQKNVKYDTSIKKNLQRCLRST
jgi:hypothetical protein